MKIIENFITSTDCTNLINFIEEKDKNKELIIAEDGRKIFNKNDFLISKIIEKSISKIKKIYNMDFDIKEHIVWLVKYQNTKNLPLHTDIITEECKKDYLSSVIYLNNNYTGGEIVYPNLNKIIHPFKKSAIIMDIHDKMYEHSVNSVTNGIKYIMPICFYKL